MHMDNDAEYYERVLADKRRLTRLIDVALNGRAAAPQASLCDILSQLEGLVREADGVPVVDQLKLARGNPGSVLTLAAPYTFPEVPGDQLLGGMPVRRYQPPVFTQRYIVGFIDRDAHDTIWYLRSHPETGAKEYSQRPEDATVMDERLSRDFVNKSPANRFSRAVV